MIFTIFLIIISIFISINSYLFLPVTAYLVATLLTNSNEFSFSRNKKFLYYFIGLVTILSLVSLNKII